MNKRLFSLVVLGSLVAAPVLSQQSSGSRDMVRIVVPFAAGGRRISHRASCPYL